MGTTNWADIFSTVSADPDAAHNRFLAQHPPPSQRPAAEKPGDLGAPAQTSLPRQFFTIAHRQLRLTVADHGYFIFLALLPFIMGVLSLSVPGDVGLGVPVPATQGGDAPNEPGQILVLLNVGAIFMGTALTIRTLIGERAIFLREQAVGLSTSAYLFGKVVIFALFALLQSAIVVFIVVRGKKWGAGAVTSGAVMSNRTLELYVDVAATCVAAAMVGLALSALAKSNEQTMPLMVVAIMSQLVFSGGMIPVTDRLALAQMSWLTPARWGFAAKASTIDLITLVPGPLTPHDSHWKHTSSAWLWDIGMLAAISIGYISFVRWKIRLSSHAKGWTRHHSAQQN
jgi:ABC transport system ATP-binding/permease protein